jgi:hypothetical protein
VFTPRPVWHIVDVLDTELINLLISVNNAIPIGQSFGELKRRSLYDIFQDCGPFMLSENDEQLSQWPELACNSEEWMKDSKRIAVAGNRQVLENGSESCSSESEAEYSDRGKVPEGMYTPDILDALGKPVWTERR